MAEVTGRRGRKTDGEGRRGRRPPPGEGATEVPKFFDEAGHLLKLKSRDFPRTKEGKMAYCDYQIERWKSRKQRVTVQADPRQRKLRKIEKLREMIEKLEAEVSAEEEAAAAVTA